jgi:hypothetical protein
VVCALPLACAAIRRAAGRRQPDTCYNAPRAQGVPQPPH